MRDLDQEMLDELEREWASGQIGEAEYLAERDRLRGRIVAKAGARERRRSGLGSWLIAVAVIALALGAVRLFAVLSVSPLEKAADACELPTLLILADDGDTLILQTPGEDGSPGFGEVEVSDVGCVLRELDVPSSVVSHIDSTRALDGQQTAEWDSVAARWTYHPSSGLSLVVTRR